MNNEKKGQEQDQPDKDDILLLNLIKMLELSVRSSLGLEKNPVTGESAKDLEAARINLDMLLMLQKKTEGNLNDILTRYLRDIITQLQMEYIKQDTSKTENKD